MDLWHLRHWLQYWQLRTWIHDNLCYLTINCDTGQHSQFLRCFLGVICIPQLSIKHQNIECEGLSSKFKHLWWNTVYKVISINVQRPFLPRNYATSMSVSYELWCEPVFASVLEKWLAIWEFFAPCKFISSLPRKISNQRIISLWEIFKSLS